MSGSAGLTNSSAAANSGDTSRQEPNPSSPSGGRKRPTDAAHRRGAGGRNIASEARAPAALPDDSLRVECFKLAIRSRAVLVGQDQFITVEEALPVMLKRNGEGPTRSVDVGGWVFTRLDDELDAAELGR